MTYYTIEGIKHFIINDLTDNESQKYDYEYIRHGETFTVYENGKLWKKDVSEFEAMDDILTTMFDDGFMVEFLEC